MVSPYGLVPVDSGSDIRFTFRSLQGYGLKDLTIDGRSLGIPSTNEFEFDGVCSNHRITVHFRCTVEDSVVTVLPGTWDFTIAGGTTYEGTMTFTAHLNGTGFEGLIQYTNWPECPIRDARNVWIRCDSVGFQQWCNDPPRNDGGLRAKVDVEGRKLTGIWGAPGFGDCHWTATKRQ